MSHGLIDCIVYNLYSQFTKYFPPLSLRLFITKIKAYMHVCMYIYIYIYMGLKSDKMKGDLRSQTKKEKAVVRW
jgi:hypothetical protein